MSTGRNLGVALDPGVKNGLCIYDYDKKEYIRAGEYTLWKVFEILLNIKDEILILYIEDARKNWSGGRGKERAQGAGWIKTLCGQYQAFAEDELMFQQVFSAEQIGVAFGYFQMIKPNNSWLKKSEDYVLNHTGLRMQGQNARDALMMFRYNGLR